MLHKGAIFLAVAALAGCNDQFDNQGPGTGEPFSPIRDSWDLDVQASNLGGFEGARAVVAIYNNTDDDLEARVDSVVEGGRFRIVFDTELENDSDYDVYWWIDTGLEDNCSADTIYVVPLGVVNEDRVVKLNPAVDDQTSCENVDGFQLFD